MAKPMRRRDRLWALIKKANSYPPDDFKGVWKARLQLEGMLLVSCVLLITVGLIFVGILTLFRRY